MTSLTNDMTVDQTLDRAAALAGSYQKVRSFSEELCDTLMAEDYVVQSMPDCSPTKWHLAHTSWFFETFILKEAIPGYQSKHPTYDFLFNSYYNSVGERHCRPKRGMISRPTVDETYAYRAYVDTHMLDWLRSAPADAVAQMNDFIILGLHHEQQHQELLVTDLKNMFGSNPLYPVFRDRANVAHLSVAPLKWQNFAEGVYEFGTEGGEFAFDNEGPRHKAYIQPFALADRLVTTGEYLAFMADNGYNRPELWLSEGWNTTHKDNIQAPLYWWKQDDGIWWQYTLSGFRPVVDAEPICHISYFEADAYARWAGARLPSEFEWELAASDQPIEGNFAENGVFHPEPASQNSAYALHQMYGDVWQWTRSQYTPYPGYETLPGALGEYNGKFMCNQFVLRGGSCATSRTHIRASYRNFFPPDARWQFSGLRLARDVR